MKNIIISIFIVLYIIYHNFYFKNIKRLIPVLIFALACIGIYIYCFSNEYKAVYKSITVFFCMLIIIDPFIRHKENLKIKTMMGEMKYYCQRDIRWGLKKYSSLNYSRRGCIPSVIAMIDSIRTSETTPCDVGKWLKSTAYIFKSGTSIEAVTEYFEKKHIAWKTIAKDDKQLLIDDLKKGVIFAVLYKKHYVVLLSSGYKNIIVDPDSPNRMIFANPDKFINKVFKKTDFSKTRTPIIGIVYNQNK